MFFRQTHCLVEILRRPRKVVVTVISRLRNRWTTLRSGTSIETTGVAKQAVDVEKRLEDELLFIASVVSGIVEDAFPGRKVTIQARLEADR